MRAAWRVFLVALAAPLSAGAADVMKGAELYRQH